jgi:hypothetical protein
MVYQTGQDGVPVQKKGRNPEDPRFLAASPWRTKANGTRSWSWALRYRLWKKPCVRRGFSALPED